MSQQYLMIPVQVDALVLETDIQLREAMATFQRMPWFDGLREHNTTVANLSEEFVTPPFTDTNLRLKSGVHLHWALPDALCRIATDEQGNSTYPLVPNYWIVQRKRGSTVEKEWLVESDYLYPEGTGANTGAISFPINPSDPTAQPFRYMGRAVPLNTLQVSGDTYLNNLNAGRTGLTAIGYGEPSFASYYPNCLSVFGLRDGDYSDTLPEGLTYTVVGYYRLPEDDELKHFLETNDWQSSPPSAEEQAAAVQEQFKWVTEDSLTNGFPDTSLCFGQVSFDVNAPVESPYFSGTQNQVTLGNNGIEAMSAYLASQLSVSSDEDRLLQEEQLEALFQAKNLSSKQLDIGATFRQTRHRRGFKGEHTGSRWELSWSQSGQTIANAQTSQELHGLAPSPTLQAQLLALNELQQELDSAEAAIRSSQHVLFSDWYKYMLSVYPPSSGDGAATGIDEVMYYIRTRDLAELSRRQTSTGQLTYQLDGGGSLLNTSGTTGFPGSLALEVDSLLNLIQEGITTFNSSEDAIANNLTLSLKSVPGPDFWHPQNPNVVLTGNGIPPSTRYGQDGRLRADGGLLCYILNLDQSIILNGSLNPDISQRISGIEPAEGVEQIGFNSWQTQPWHPFLLEWMVQSYPLSDGSNAGQNQSQYASDFIQRNYFLPENENELQLQPNKGAIITAPLTYSGVSVLTPFAGNQFKTRLNAYLQTTVLPEYLRANQVSLSDSEKETWLLDASNLTAVIAWYESTYPGAEASDSRLTYLLALQDLLDLHYLSQTLSGFNEALLQHRETFQLGLSDPLGFPAYQNFTSEVKDAVADRNRIAPEPQFSFSPVRSGALKLNRLRVLDNFGRWKDIDVHTFGTSEPMTWEPKLDNMAYLPPRITQPARLNFDWIKKDNFIEDEQGNPILSPVRGWLLPNHLDQSLFFYNRQGKALGLLLNSGTWLPAPGSEDAVYEVEYLSDPEVKQIVDYLQAQETETPGFISDFVGNLDGAQENIEPENYAEHGGTALLMGQPIAIAKSSLRLELQGSPAIRHDWFAFNLDLSRTWRNSAQFEFVQFPVRLGEYSLLNDGLIGYWVNEGGGFKDELFYAPQSSVGDEANINVRGELPFTVNLSLKSPTIELTMLLDPRGLVHATTGIFPTQQLQLERNQYTGAMKGIEISFLSSPLLLETGRTGIPIPTEPGYTWNFIHQESTVELTEEDIGPARTGAVFPGRPIAKEGWLKLKPQPETDSQ